MKKRILICERATSLGGSVFSALQLLNLFEKNGYEVYYGMASSSPYSDLIRSKGVKTQFISPFDLTESLEAEPGLKKKIRKVRALITSTYKTLRCIRKNKISMVHANDSLSMNVPDILAARICGIPVVCHIRSIRPIGNFDKMIAPYVRKFFAVSSAAKENYVKQGIIESSVEVIYNSVSLDTFSPKSKNAHLCSKLGLIDGVPTVGLFTRLASWKGVDLFLKAFSRLINDGIQTQALIVGDGPERETLISLSKELKIFERVKFVGEVTHVEDYFSCCDFVVQPSTNPDPFPRTVIEAMASGKAVVGSNSGGISESIINNVTGLLFEPKNESSLVAAMKELLLDECKRNTFGFAGRKSAEERFSLYTTGKKVLDLYDQL